MRWTAEPGRWLSLATGAMVLLAPGTGSLLEYSNGDPSQPVREGAGVGAFRPRRLDRPRLTRRGLGGGGCRGHRGEERWQDPVYHPRGEDARRRDARRALGRREAAEREAHVAGAERQAAAPRGEP